MYFSYVNFPKVPSQFITECFKRIPLIETDPFLIKVNELEADAVRITSLPAELIKWLMKEIIFKHFTHLSDNLMYPFLHVSQHKPILSIGPESHAIHYDYGRHYAFNYILDPGGSTVVTKWHKGYDNIILEQHTIQPFRWHIIATNPELHSVSGIEEGKKRVTIGLNWNPPIEKPLFNASEYWKKYLQNE